MTKKELFVELYISECLDMYGMKIVVDTLNISAAMVESIVGENFGDILCRIKF